MMAYFQYLEEHWAYKGTTKAQDNEIRVMQDWLNENVGKQGDARDTNEQFDWAWSLSFVNGRYPRGIYLTREIDKVRMLLQFSNNRRSKYPD